MDFTREPIIETVITPKEGHKLVVRSSKSAGQEEYFVEAVEVVSFGHSLFFRSIERPKAFLVPVSDYEVLEVRETRMVLKNVGIERAIKIGGGREGKPPKELQREKAEQPAELVNEAEIISAGAGAEVSAEVRSDGKVEKKRDRRRHARRRRGRDEETASEELSEEEKEISSRSDDETALEGESQALSIPVVPFSTMLPPPTTLISESIARYKDNALFKGAFFIKDEEGRKEGEFKEEGILLSDEPLGEEKQHDDLLDSLQNVSLEPSDYGTFEPSEEIELYQQEASHIFSADEDTVQTFLQEDYEEKVELTPPPHSEPKNPQDESLPS